MTRYTLSVLLLAICFYTTAQQSFQQLTENGYTQLVYGDTKVALIKLKQAEKILPKTLSLKDKAIFFNNLGVAYYKCGDYKEGIDQYKLALNYHYELGNDSLIAESLLNLGLAYKEIGLYNRAIKEIIKSARVFERNGNERGIASAWNAIGNIQRELGNYPKALEYHRKALNKRVKIDYRKGIADSYHNIGHVYLDMRRLNEAETYFLKAYKRKQLLGKQANVLTTLTLLGEVYLLQHRKEEAYSCLNTAYDLRLASGNSSKIASSLFYLGSFYAENGNTTKAYEVFRECETMAEENNDFGLLADALLGEITLLRKDGNKAMLVVKYEKLLSVQKQEDIEVNKKELAKLEIVYDVERKNNALESSRKQSKLDKARIENHRLRNQQLLIGLVVLIVLIVGGAISWNGLRQRKQQIEQQNGVLAKQTLEITNLHAELSHRTKNYFGLLSGILKSDRDKTENAEVIDVLNENIRRMEAMELMQHHLSASSSVKSDVRLDTYLNQLLDSLIWSLFPRGANVQLERKIAVILLDYDLAMRLGIVLNELICNVIKHGLKGVEDAALTVEVWNTGNVLEMVVKNNGHIPFDENSVKESSKGQVLVELLLQYMDGNIVFRQGSNYTAHVTIKT